ncbi:hypothetical protein BN1708_007996, partial [Verticillium longisporum]
MKRVRTLRCTGQLLSTQTRAAIPSCHTPISTSFKTATAAAVPRLQQSRLQSTSATPSTLEAAVDDLDIPEYKPLPSPLPARALTSPKLAALHARLSLPSKLPLQTLARCLVDPSVVAYPRLPMAILFEAMRSYAGPASLAKIAQQWGVEMAAAPGEEVDPGLLQYSLDPKAGVVHTRWGYVRKEAAHIDKFKWRRGTSSRIVYDDEFGDTVHKATRNPHDATSAADLASADRADIRQNANAAFVRALVGALYVHGGRESVRSFVDAHILARRVDLESLFSFKLPTRELAMLCAREGFEAPVAGLLSETGRHSRTPVFVVGIYSGQDKLGEGTGASLDFARLKASMNALKAWYLYSPGAKSRVPSDMLSEGAKPWQPVHIDMGEVI